VGQSGLNLQDAVQSLKPLSIQALHTLLALGLCRLILIVCELVHALTLDERHQLQTVIVDRAGLDKDLQRLLEKLMMPAGYIDKCVPVMQFVSKWGLMCCAVPFVELLLGLFLPSHTNGSLVVWLRCDSLHWIIAVIAAYVLKASGEALVVEKFDEFIEDDGGPLIVMGKNDPETAVGTEENSSSIAEKSAWTRAYKLAVTCFVAAIVLLLALVIGGLGGLVAGVELLVGFFVVWHGSVGTYVLCLCFDILRIGLTAIMAYAVYVPVNDVWTLYKAGEGDTNGLTNSKDIDYGSVA